jgi:hypothetical protein
MTRIYSNCTFVPATVVHRANHRLGIDVLPAYHTVFAGSGTSFAGSATPPLCDIQMNVDTK